MDEMKQRREELKEYQGLEKEVVERSGPMTKEMTER
jgi:hypothetical protein